MNAMPLQAQQEAPVATAAARSSPAAHTAAASAAFDVPPDAQRTRAQRPADGKAAKWPILREGDGGREVRTVSFSHCRFVSLLVPAEV